jgi:hypothetical protein
MGEKFIHQLRRGLATRPPNLIPKSSAFGKAEHVNAANPVGS